MGSITLHDKLGVNPRLTTCVRCGGEGQDLLLLGAKNRKFTCDTCHTVSIASSQCIPCTTAGRYTTGKSEELGEFERIPSGLCKECEAEITEHAALVAAGGVYWQCKDCHKGGVIKASSPFAQEVRTKLNVAAPAECGVEFDHNNCPACS